MLSCRSNLRSALLSQTPPPSTLRPSSSSTVDPSVLLSGIGTSTALQLSSSVRYSTCLAPSFISGLDGLVDDGAPLRKGDIVELQGVTGSGKTTLLLYLTMTAILPRRVGQTQVGGKEQAVVWIDCTLRFDIRRLASMCQGHLRNMLGSKGAVVLDQEVEKCLKRFTLFEPKSMLQLAATVQGLPDWQMEHGEEDIGYVMIDGMSEFAWADQWATETLSKAPSTAAAAPSSFVSEPTPGHSLRLLIASLARLRSTLAPITLLTQWAFRPTNVTRYSTTTAETRGGQGLPFYGHHLPTSSGWPSIDRSARGVTTAADPLAPTSNIPGTSLPSFALDYHVTCYPPTPTMMRRGTTMVEAFERRREGRGEGTAGFKCVLREKGGREVGMWEWEVTSEGGVIA